jgi:ABC-2 type transport system ATP-binding protein
VQTRGQILEVVRGLARDGSAVVYSTHYLPEIETLGADVAFIDRGRLVAQGSTAQLLERYATSALELTFDGAIPATAHVEGATVAGNTVRVPAADPAARAAQLLPALGSDASALRSIEVVRPSLESVYLAVTGRRYASEPAEAAA